MGTSSTSVIPSQPHQWQSFLFMKLFVFMVFQSIGSDKDKIFMSHFWKSLFKSQGTSLKMSTAYHPQTDGQTKVVNRCIETYLRCFYEPLLEGPLQESRYLPQDEHSLPPPNGWTNKSCQSLYRNIPPLNIGTTPRCIETDEHSSKPRSWAKFLPWAEYWYNTSLHYAINTTPFQVVYGRDPSPLIQGIPSALPNSTMDQLLQDCDYMLIVLREHLVHAQQRMKSYADRHHRDLSFQIGDLVYLKLHHYRLSSLARRVNEKFAPKFYGPFSVIQCIGSMAYKCQLLPSSSTIHLFSTFPNSGQLWAILPPQLSEDLELLLEPDSVLGYCMTGPSILHDVEVLIKWKDMPTHETTWELFVLIQN